MPIFNLNNAHISAADKTRITDALDDIMEVLTPISVNLSPEDRKRYGSVAEQSKLIVQKVLDYNNSQPHLSTPDVSYTEMAADWTSRSFMAAVIARLTEAATICNNIRITHDYDAYNLARQDYDYTKYKKDTQGGASWETKYDELKALFTTNPGGGTTPPPDGNNGE